MAQQPADYKKKTPGVCTTCYEYGMIHYGFPCVYGSDVYPGSIETMEKQYYGPYWSLSAACA